MEIWQQLGFFAKLTLAIDLVPVAMAVIYLLRPTERHLALMRPFSLAGLFAALAGGAVGFLVVLRSIGLAADFTQSEYRRMALGASEALAPAFVGFACLSVAWLVVAVGMSRSRGEGLP